MRVALCRRHRPGERFVIGSLGPGSCRAADGFNWNRRGLTPPTSQAHESLLGSAPGEWRIELIDGVEVGVTAHGYKEDNGTYIFSLLLGNSPAVELTVARFDSAWVCSPILTPLERVVLTNFGSTFGGLCVVASCGERWVHGKEVPCGVVRADTSSAA